MKAPQKSLKRWTKQKWRTKSGKKSSETGERYLPSKAIKKELLSITVKSKSTGLFAIHSTNGIPFESVVKLFKLERDGKFPFGRTINCISLLISPNFNPFLYSSQMTV